MELKASLSGFHAAIHREKDTLLFLHKRLKELPGFKKAGFICPVNSRHPLDHRVEEWLFPAQVLMMSGDNMIGQLSEAHGIRIDISDAELFSAFSMA